MPIKLTQTFCALFFTFLYGFLFSNQLILGKVWLLFVPIVLAFFV